MWTELTAAIRSLGRARGYTLAVLLILSLGLGSATAIFTMIESSLFPAASSIPNPDTLVRIEMNDPRGSTFSFLKRVHFVAYRETRLSSFREFAGSMGEEANLVRDTQITPVSALRVTTNFLGVLGVSPSLGRGFLPEDEQAAGVQPIILSDRFWRTEFGADPSAIGRMVNLGDRASLIIGVLPSGFQMPNRTDAQLFLPFSQAALTVTPATAGMALWAYARLNPGVALATAEAELRTLRPGAELPGAKSWELQLPVIVPHDALPVSLTMNKYRLKNWTMLGAVGLLYVIACVNAGNLMLVRTLDRRRELGVRCALGGSRWRVVRPVLLEGVVLTLVATLLGFVVAKWLFSLLLALTPAALAPWEPLQLSSRSLLLLAGLGGLVGLLLALVPLWQTSRLDIHAALKAGGQAGASLAGTGLRDTFVVVQTALAVTLLISTGLMMRTCRQLLATDLGFNPDRKVLIRVNSPSGEPTPIAARRERTKRVAEALATLPGVHSVSATSGFTFTGGILQKISVVGAENSAGDTTVPTSSVGADYFATLGVPLLLGRNFTDVRPGSPPVAVISDSLARQFFSGTNPLGRKLAPGRGASWEIIGVVGDVRRPREEASPRIYIPVQQELTFITSAQLLVRLKGDLSPQFEAEVRRTVLAIEPNLIVGSIRKLESFLLSDTQTERSALIHLQALGSLALALAAFGLFAMMDYNVTQRRIEFGVRYAIGATDADLQRLVLGRGLKLVALGLAIGVALAWMLAHSLNVFLYQTPALDGFTNAVVAVLLFGTALLACWLPVRRAADIDPARLLRAE